MSPLIRTEAPEGAVAICTCTVVTTGRALRLRAWFTSNAISAIETTEPASAPTASARFQFGVEPGGRGGGGGCGGGACIAGPCALGRLGREDPVAAGGAGG